MKIGKMTKVINIFGGPGSGKTTASLGLTYHMKLKNINCELVSEYAKSLLWSNRLEDMQDQQEYMFVKQNHMIHRLRDKVDYVIVDSPVLLNHIYTTLSKQPWEARDSFKAFVVATFNTYNNINFVMDRPEYFETEGRIQNKKQATEIDHLITHELVMLRIPYTIVAADNNTIDNILNFI